MDKNEKSKIEGVDKKELTIFVAIIGIIIILLMFEFLFFEGRTEVAEEIVQAQEQLEQMTEVTVEAEQKKVYNALNNIMSKMNNKDYKSLYDMLKDDYKNYYFPKYETFEEFIKVYAGQEYYPKYTSYYRDDNLYYIMVDFIRQNYTRKDLLSIKSSKVDTIVLEEIEEGKFKFAMNGFVEVIFHDEEEIVEGVTFSLQTSVRNTETIKNTVFISNHSNKKVSVSTDNLKPEILGGNTAVISTTSSVHLDPGEIGSLTIEYYMQYNSNKEFQGITITGAYFSDGTVIEDVFLAK